jgi:hypothetical protein
VKVGTDKGEAEEEAVEAKVEAEVAHEPHEPTSQACYPRMNTGLYLRMRKTNSTGSVES